jgi:alpha-mannosidase
LQESYDLNCNFVSLPLEKQDGFLPTNMSFALVDKANVILDTIKMAEEGSEIILRFNEAYNRRTSVNVTMFQEITGVRECDLMENDLPSSENKHAFHGQRLSFDILPFEIKTFKISFKCVPFKH